MEMLLLLLSKMKNYELTKECLYGGSSSLSITDGCCCCGLKVGQHHLCRQANDYLRYRATSHCSAAAGIGSQRL